MPILVEGTDLPLWGMEIDTEREKERFKAWSAGAWCGSCRPQGSLRQLLLAYVASSSCCCVAAVLQLLCCSCC